ncbi:MAG TPA: ScyD/ScyE family protein [Baekduia sp.]|uniref:ScyD/ScyE family protein n=1 Tax=Baekduia sp. TaxID=2600305 RepID=UPI002CD631A3|nr:ScyD/ScyE family protein [Baekduia sp.]HMJ37113.1 ScyD/ScyE family protein [Baekduia sp.]
MSAPRILVLLGVSMLSLAAPAGAAQVEKIAGGLDNPRHLAFGGRDLYVAEAGRGGDGPCFAGPEGGDVCVGATGAVTVIDRDGGQRRLVDGLASLADKGTGASAIGPHGIDVRRVDDVFVTNGGPTEANRDELAKQNSVADLFGRVLRIGSDGDIRRLVDVWGFERDNNPDAKPANPAIDSNAVDVLARHGRFIVADAGGNSLLKAGRDGRIEVLSIFGNRNVKDPFGSGEIPMQAVPTGVVKGPDGDYFMSQLTGFPFPVGGANVYRVDRHSGEAQVFASGFTNIMDLAFDDHGTLWVLEIDHDSLLTPIGPSSDGAIFSVDENGDKTQLDLPKGTLTNPGGITVGEDGALYVTNKATAAGDGEVLRIDPEQ